MTVAVQQQYERRNGVLGILFRASYFLKRWKERSEERKIA